MSPLEHAFFASGLITPEELDEALARQLIFGGDLSTSILEVTRLSEEQVARILSQALGHDLAPPSLQIHVAQTRSVRLRGVPALVVRTSPEGQQPQWAVVSTGELSLEQAELAKNALKADFTQLLVLELRAREAEYQLGTQAEDERFLRLLSRLGRAAHVLISSESLPEPLAPLRTEFTGTAEDNLENTAPPPMDYEDLAARAAVDAAPSSRLKSTSAGADPECPPIEQARSKDELILAALNLLNDSFRFAACFAVQKGEARGILARARNGQAKGISNVGIPLDFPSVFQKSLEGDSITVARPKASGVEGGVLEDLDRSPGTEVLLLPVRVRKRPVLLLWVDDGRGAEPSLELGQANAARRLVARALERLLLDRKRSKLGAPPSQLNLAEEPGVPSASPGAMDPPSREMTPMPGALHPAGLTALRVSDPPAQDEPQIDDQPPRHNEPLIAESAPALFDEQPPSRRGLKDIEPRPPSDAPPRFADSRAPIAAETLSRTQGRRPALDEPHRLAIGRIRSTREAENPRVRSSAPTAVPEFAQLRVQGNLEPAKNDRGGSEPGNGDEPRLSARTLLSRQPYVGAPSQGTAEPIDEPTPSA